MIISDTASADNKERLLRPTAASEPLGAAGTRCALCDFCPLTTALKQPRLTVLRLQRVLHTLRSHCALRTVWLAPTLSRTLDPLANTSILPRDSSVRRYLEKRHLVAESAIRSLASKPASHVYDVVHTGLSAHWHSPNIARMAPLADTLVKLEWSAMDTAAEEVGAGVCHVWPMLVHLDEALEDPSVTALQPSDVAMFRYCG